MACSTSIPDPDAVARNRRFRVERPSFDAELEFFGTKAGARAQLDAWLREAGFDLTLLSIQELPR